MSAARRTMAILVSAMGLALTGAGLSGLVSPASAQPAQRTPETIYATNCGYCHGHNVGPIIRGRKLPAPMVEFMVRNGRGAMPAFRPTEITPAELAALASWINTSSSDAQEHGK